MTDDPPCTHANLEYDVGGVKAPASNVILTEIAARCADCGVVFKWLGRFKGKQSSSEPFISEDGLWLTLPACPVDENPVQLITREPPLPVMPRNLQ